MKGEEDKIVHKPKDEWTDEDKKKAKPNFRAVMDRYLCRSVHVYFRQACQN
jgi:hypothetical protein